MQIDEAITLFSLCKNGKIQDTTSILDDMLQMGINPNISTFRMLIEAFCKASDFGVAKELFKIGLYVVTKSLHTISSTLTQTNERTYFFESACCWWCVFSGRSGKEGEWESKS
ncbi:hypothetical protein Gotur_033727 [Gossypium turneri]